LPQVPGISDGISYSTPNLAPMPQGGRLAEFDEYRCFPVTTSLSKDQFITAYDVVPGNAALVHHVVAFLIDPAKVTKSGKTNAEVMQALDALEPNRVGWPCYGMAGEGVEVEAVPAVWAPGQGPVVYAGNVGVRQKVSHQLVVQIHYNLTDPKLAGQTDSTT